ncbi:hypothetical protein CDD82_2051 [Ophiocordyceps australis]|uniref:Deacetylase sirtuin-type domain-containing protein n=1 Tax=Ophiocordyceps australis TaxID=1399860 RepID=A0A2C5XGR2_9HYPO|nr:hypothetical protein CDD82_2051 [Ophiocordyceps australis]
MDSPVASPLASLPSSPLSSLSHTPSLPDSPRAQPDAAGRYPSPMSFSASSDGPCPVVQRGGDAVAATRTQLAVDAAASAQDAPPRPKKRRVAPPRDRSTKHLNLLKDYNDLTCDDEFQMRRLIKALRNKKKIVVVAGAGISVSAGIPDFRSATGLFATTRSQDKLKASGKHLFDASVYKHDASTISFHTMVRQMARLTRNAAPTPFHHLVASLAKEGRLLRLYSQNIDCIDTSMEPLATKVPLEPKGPWPPTIQLHGGLEKMVCTKCGHLESFNGELFDGPQAPLCEQCKEFDQVRTYVAGKRSHGIGRLRPRFVLYNEYHPDEEAIGNVARADLKARPDAVLVVGTSLKVPGTRRLVKEMCQVTRGRKDGFTAWINIDAEPKGAEFRDCWDLVVRSTCDNVAKLAALPPHDCDIGTNYLVSHEQYAAKTESLEKQNFAIVLSANSPGPLDAKPKAVDAAAIAAIPTPRPSPPVSSSKPQVAKQTKLPLTSRPQGRRQLPSKAPKSRVAKQPPKPNKTMTDAFKAAKKGAAAMSLGAKPNGGPKTGFGLPSLRPENPPDPLRSFFTVQAVEEQEG